MLLAVYQAIQDVGGKPSKNAVIACVRRQGHKFTDSEAKALLGQTPPGRRTDEAVRAPQIPHERTGGPVRAPSPHRLRAGARADLKGIVDMASSSGSYEPPLLALDAATATNSAKSNGSRAPKLPLIDATEERSREILDLFWPIVQTTVGSTLTRDAWRKRNKADARNLANVGRSDADLIAAHERASKRIGGCVYSLKIVTDELLRIDHPVTMMGRSGPYDRAPENIAPEDRR
jgi:hypothetical protein